MSANTLTRPQYTKLARDIRLLIEDGKKRAAQAVSSQLVETYWKVGERISAEGLSEYAGYNSSIFESLSAELNIDESTLIRSIQFFNTYSTATRGSNINWSHIKRLLPIANKEERDWYEGLIVRENLTVPLLASAIRSDRFGKEKAAKGKGKVEKLKRPTASTYLYKAVVVRVVDGDTLLLRIDLGFTVFKEQRIRLNFVDTPEKETPEGQKAHEFVLNTLAQVPFVMVKTNKIDIYGRYLGDVFYLHETTDKNKIFILGKYLNQELISRGLAKVV